nr:DoxX family protein [Limimaricola pyoseonensis]
MTRHSPEDLGVFLLRVALGVMFLAHSLLLKLVVFGLPGTAAFFVSLGLPGWSAYLVFAVEVAAGFMLVLGLQTRFAALAVLPILLGATWAHSGHGWMFANPNGGWEYPAYLALLAVAQLLLGDGAFALGRSGALRLPAPRGRAAG